MEQKDWLTIPNLICRLCGARIEVAATEKRPVSELYAFHDKGLGLCPNSDDVVRLDDNGQMIEKLVEKGVTLRH